MDDWADYLTLATVVGNVPLNDALLADGEREWARYLDAWTTWNHVRTGTAIVATGLLAVALTQ